MEGNLLHSWDQVYFLGNELTQLEELSLSGNRLALMRNSLGQNKIDNDGVTYEVQVDQLFPNLKTLVLNNMDLDWADFHLLLAAFREVNNFIMVGNKLNHKGQLEDIDVSRL